MTAIGRKQTSRPCLVEAHRAAASEKKDDIQMIELEFKADDRNRPKVAGIGWRVELNHHLRGHPLASL